MQAAVLLIELLAAFVKGYRINVGERRPLVETSG
jgi:hypothetical protein